MADPFRIKAERTSVTGWTDEGGGGWGGGARGKLKQRESEGPSERLTVDWFWVFEKGVRCGRAGGVASGLYLMRGCEVSGGDLRKVKLYKYIKEKMDLEK